MKIMAPLGSHCWIRQEEVNCKVLMLGGRVCGVWGAPLEKVPVWCEKSKTTKGNSPRVMMGLAQGCALQTGTMSSLLGALTTPDDKSSPCLLHPHCYSSQHYRTPVWASRAVKSDSVKSQDENLPIKQLFYRGNCCRHAVSLQKEMSISAKCAGGPGNGDTCLFGEGWTSLIPFQLCHQTNYFSH